MENRYAHSWVVSNLLDYFKVVAGFAGRMRMALGCFSFFCFYIIYRCIISGYIYTSAVQSLFGCRFWGDVSPSSSLQITSVFHLLILTFHIHHSF